LPKTEVHTAEAEKPLPDRGMPIIYVIISRGPELLMEYKEEKVELSEDSTAARILLSKVGHNNHRMSYKNKERIYHYIVEDGITYFCATDSEVKYRIPFAFLEEIKGTFRGQYGSEVHTAVAYAFDKEFKPVVKERATFYNTNPESDTISRVQNQLDQVREVMVENIDKLLERGEKIELLLDKTEDLNMHAGKFQKQSKKLHYKMWCRNMKFYAIVTVMFLMLLYVILAMACGFNFGKCMDHTGGGSSNSTVVPSPPPSPAPPLTVVSSGSIARGNTNEQAAVLAAYVASAKQLLSLVGNSTASSVIDTAGASAHKSSSSSASAI
jgi:vesicle-associated membrane protein 7